MTTKDLKEEIMSKIFDGDFPNANEIDLLLDKLIELAMNGQI